MSAITSNTILLFFKDPDFEYDTFVPYDRYLRRIVWPLYKKLRRGRTMSGFAMSFQNLVTALRESGYEVRVNDYALARKHPAHPVGLVGGTDLLDGWRLPNPAVLGPSLYDQPRLAPNLMRDPRYHYFLVLCDWQMDVFRPYYGDACVLWHAGVDTRAWPDTRSASKSVDFLVYDKILWNRQEMLPKLLQPILATLDRRGMTNLVIRYRKYDHATYRAALRAARGMIFLSPHETQGLAYQEALASNLPVLAWDPGFWLDPQRLEITQQPIPATSVPYFSDECGERFVDVSQFEASLERFLANLQRYQPRRFVERELSLEDSAQLYAKYYFSLL